MVVQSHYMRRQTKARTRLCNVKLKCGIIKMGSRDMLKCFRNLFLNNIIILQKLSFKTKYSEFFITIEKYAFA